MPVCPSCRTVCDPDDRFCPECGGRLAAPLVPAPCPRCGEAADEGDLFCCLCGAPLGTRPEPCAPTRRPTTEGGYDQA